MRQRNHVTCINYTNSHQLTYSQIPSKMKFATFKLKNQTKVSLFGNLAIVVTHLYSKGCCNCFSCWLLSSIFTFSASSVVLFWPCVLMFFASYVPGIGWTILGGAEVVRCLSVGCFFPHCSLVLRLCLCCTAVT
jgi:hypothetical protein